MLIALSLATSARVEAQAASEPVASAPRFSLSLERFASLNAIFVSVDDGEDEFKLRSKGITAGGPIANPLGASRLAVDFLTRSGFTLGAGLAFGFGDLDSDEADQETDEGGYSLIMVAPRVGYRIALADWLDLTPRAGMTLGWARITANEYESCDYEYDEYGYEEIETNCVNGADSVSMFATVANLELAAAFRLTDSFNILAGLSYDLLVSAKVTEEDAYSEDSEDSEEESFKDGHVSSLQLWLGVGGYL
jgi:hypothetical protein